MTWFETYDVHVLRTEEDLREGPACDQLERILEEATRGARRVLLALGPGTRLSAHALGVVAHACAEATRRGGALVVSACDPSQRWLLEVTGLAGVLHLHASEQEALAALAPSAAA